MLIAGIDIGGTKCSVTLAEVNVNGIHIIEKIKIKTCDYTNPHMLIDDLCNEIRRLCKNNKGILSDLNGIGISCGGPLDSKNGIILSPPNLIAWDNINIVRIIEEKLKIKCWLQNDANACALAEWQYGAGKGYSNVVFITFGTGFGAGLILDNKLYSGTNDMAGEIGHIRIRENGPVGYGKAGSLEGFCSGGGIKQLAKIKVLEKFQQGEKVSFCSGINDLENIDAKIVGDAAEKGDILAKEIYTICAENLGRGLSIIIDMLNPELIIIGSIYNRSKQLLEETIMEVINKEALSHSRKVCRVLPAKLGEQLGDYAALTVAITNIKK